MDYFLGSRGPWSHLRIRIREKYVFLLSIFWKEKELEGCRVGRFCGL
jgi:hypothetical protein